MALQASQQPPESTSAATDNPIAAVGKKVKSALSSRNQPSIRIQRQSSPSERYTEKPLPHLPPQSQHPAGNFAAETSFTGRLKSLFNREEHSNDSVLYDQHEDDSYVDLLDVVDPEVATLSTITNVQNSLFVPQLGKLVNRRPTYRITESASDRLKLDRLKTLLKKFKNKVKDKATPPSKFEFAVLPDDEKLEGWTAEEKEELDDMVRHQLHSKRAKFKRSMKGFKQYVRRPFGLFITVYATLITLFGTAWVLFLIGWISLGSKQDYVVNVVDNIMVALFAIIGDGLAPFRAVDTYHMVYIAYYHRKTWKKREQLGLPDLVDHNDLPNQQKQDSERHEIDLESLVARKMPRGLARRVAPRIPQKYAHRMVARSKTNNPTYEYTVLTPEEQEKLEYHERKFSKSHTFYKPHETETHYAFPLKLLVAVVLLLDLHSCLQITLGACTWGINYHTRPFALTTVILCFSITCNITGGVLISRGDKKTRKHEIIERIERQELTSEAIEQIVSQRLKEAEERGEISPDVRKKMEEEKEAQENEEIKKSWKSVPSLPKKLLGKGEDHRQPSLPQDARSSSSVAVDGKGKGKGKGKIKSGLNTVDEYPTEPSRPQPVVRKPVPGSSAEDPEKVGTGRKLLEFVRRADLDRS